MEKNVPHAAVLMSQLRNELTEAQVYARLAAFERNEANRSLLEKIGTDEAAHARVIAGLLGRTARPFVFKVAWITLCARLLGLTFVLKLMERGENTAGKAYRAMLTDYPQLAVIAEEEDRHEDELIGRLADERLDNMGSIVLGLNDALVELTGALAGFTFAFDSPVKIAKLGLITGFAAAMSMAASSFLSARAEKEAGGEAGPGASKAALYTGLAYVLTVVLLVSPYLLLSQARAALVAMLVTALGIIAFFNFYLSVARGTPFRRGFLVMAGLSSGVALISYGFGYLLR